MKSPSGTLLNNEDFVGEEKQEMTRECSLWSELAC